MYDEKKSEQHKEQSEPSYGEADPKDRVHQVEDRKPSNDQAQYIESKSYARVKPHLPLRLWRYIRHRQIATPPANWAERSTVFITFVIAVVGAVQAGIYWQQKRIMESSGTQTNQLISAADIQADAATRSASAAEQFTDAAKTQSEAMTKIFKLQRDLARLDRGGARLTVRTISMFHRDSENKIWAGIVVQNDGTTVHAEQIGCAAKIDILSSAPKSNPDEFKDKDYSPTLQPGPLPPIAGGIQNVAQCWEPFPTRNLTPERYSGYKKAKIGEIYIWGVFRHTDLGGEVVFDPFCKQISVKAVFDSPEWDKTGKGDSFRPPSCR